MAHTTPLIGFALASILVTGCSSGDTGTTSDSRASAVAPSAVDSAATNAGGTGSGTGGSVTPAELDQTTTAWFSTFCGDLAELQSSSEAIGASISAGTGTPPEQQRAIVAAVNDIGATFKKTAVSLSAVPAPTIAQGAALAGNVTVAFNGVGDALIGAGQTFGTATVSDEASLNVAGQVLSTSLQQSFAQIGTSLTGLSEAVTPEIAAAVDAIPGCEVLGT